jgi:hypothetical protein
VSFVEEYDEFVLTPLDGNVGFRSSATDSCAIYHGEKMTLEALLPRSRRVIAMVILVQIQGREDM